MEHKKSFAIYCAKAMSIQLYSRLCLTTDSWVELRNYMSEIRNGIIEELGINMKLYAPDDNPEYDDKTINDLIIYDAIAKSGETITLYDLIDWFNNQYNSIRQDTKDLPKLQFPIKKFEKGTVEEASFVFEQMADNYVYASPMLHFVNENDKINEYFHRILCLAKKDDGSYCQNILVDGPSYILDENIDCIPSDVIKDYLEISEKYKDYLSAYRFLRRSNTATDKSQPKKGPFTTAIIGNDPYRDLSHFVVHYGHGGNEPGYIFSYGLGDETLKEPILDFLEYNVVGDDLEDQEDIRKNNPHVLAKTLRVNRDILPFKIK